MAGGSFLLRKLAMSELLSMARMARRIGVTQQWLQEQADAGNVPCLKAGKRYLFNAVAVQEALAAKAANRASSGGQYDGE